MVRIEKSISYGLGSNVLFDNVGYGENILILYHNTNNHQQIFKNILTQMNTQSSLLFYLAHTSNELSFDFTVRNHYFNVLTEDTIHTIKKQLDQCFKRREEQQQEMLLIADWSKVSADKCPIFLPFIQELIKKSQGLSPEGWKRKYRDVKKKTPFLLINTFEASKLSPDFIQQLIPLHHRVFLLQENQHTMQLPTLSPAMETIFPKTHILPQELLEKLVKDNLQLIVLLFLEGGGAIRLSDPKKHCPAFSLHTVARHSVSFALPAGKRKQNPKTKWKRKRSHLFLAQKYPRAITAGKGNLS